ncbi:hypothetical protein [Clostridium sp. C8-1-8]|uniref:hypothetical protein n=1 Tax=Clostridium sp. C8-1-8 TaxID=2698831 RepID=UPI00136E4E30|nr:hypothetical protein [Clostridium sp. C8-1-8]
MQFNYKKDIITCNSSALAFSVLRNNVDLNRVKVVLDNETGKRMFVLSDYSMEELEAYKHYVQAVKNGTAIQVDIIEFNHIYSCLKQMVMEFKYSE